MTPKEQERAMTPKERIDANLERVLRASGSSLRHYTLPKVLVGLREAMRQIMSESYIAGSNDHAEAIKAANARGKTQ